MPGFLPRLAVSRKNSSGEMGVRSHRVVGTDVFKVFNHYQSLARHSLSDCNIK